jgi:hypothetical protein
MAQPDRGTDLLRVANHSCARRDQVELQRFRTTQELSRKFVMMLID